MFGHSYGGYSAILQSQLFPTVWNACIAWNPGVFEQAKDPLDLEVPPRAPLCLIYGEHDHRTDWSEELIAYVESEVSHEPDAFEYHRLSDVGHHTVNPERKSEVWRIVSAFVRKHLE